MEQELPSATADPFAPSAAEAARQTILKRLTAGLLLIAGLAGVWVLVDTLPADAPATPPAKATKTIRQTGGVIPAEQHTVATPAAPAVASAPSAPAQAPSMPPVGGNQNANPPDAANPASPAATSPVAPAPAATAGNVITSVAPAEGQPAVAAATKAPTPSVTPSVTQQPAAPPPTASETKAVETAPGVPEVVQPAAPTRNKTAAKQSTAKKPSASNHANEQFAVQMGVFKVIDNAEKLRAKMALSDIPVLFEKQATETRVLAGPFATRAQALQARDDMEKSGLGKGMLVPLKK